VQNVAEKNCTKALSADCCFLEPEGADSARSSYRLLGEGFLLLYNIFLL